MLLFLLALLLSSISNSPHNLLSSIQSLQCSVSNIYSQGDNIFLVVDLCYLIVSSFFFFFFFSPLDFRLLCMGYLNIVDHCVNKHLVSDC